MINDPQNVGTHLNRREVVRDTLNHDFFSRSKTAFVLRGMFSYLRLLYDIMISLSIKNLSPLPFLLQNKTTIDLGLFYEIFNIIDNLLSNIFRQNRN